MEDKKKNEEIKAEKAVDTNLDEDLELSDDELDLVQGGAYFCKFSDNYNPANHMR